MYELYTLSNVNVRPAFFCMLYSCNNTKHNMKQMKKIPLTMTSHNAISHSAIHLLHRLLLCLCCLYLSHTHRLIPSTHYSFLSFTLSSLSSCSLFIFHSFTDYVLVKSLSLTFSLCFAIMFGFFYILLKHIIYQDKNTNKLMECCG